MAVEILPVICVPHLPSSFSHRETTVLGFLSIIPGFLYYCLITKMDSDFPLFYATGSTFFKNNFYLYCGKIYITMTVETTLSL